MVVTTPSDVDIRVRSRNGNGRSTELVQKRYRQPWRIWISVNDVINSVQCETLSKHLVERRYQTDGYNKWMLGRLCEQMMLVRLTPVVGDNRIELFFVVMS
jgi:hypothetical protein